MDDGSTDESISVIEKYTHRHPELFFLYQNPNKGSNNARNFGFEKSSGEYIQWLDSDDEILPGKLRAQIKSLRSTNAHIVYSDWKIRYYEENALKREEVRYYQNYSDFLYQLLKDNWTSPNNYLITRGMAKRLHELNAWNPETKIGQDREYFTMAGLSGAIFTYQDGVFAIYNKQSTNSISTLDFQRRLEENQKLEGKFREEILKSGIFNPKTKKSYIRVLNTHTVKACYYHSTISFPYYISPLGIKWSMIHWKMRFVIPWILLKKNFELLK